MRFVFFAAAVTLVVVVTIVAVGTQFALEALRSVVGTLALSLPSPPPFAAPNFTVTLPPISKTPPPFTLPPAASQTLPPFAFVG